MIKEPYNEYRNSASFAPIDRADIPSAAYSAYFACQSSVKLVAKLYRGN